MSVNGEKDKDKTNINKLTTGIVNWVGGIRVTVRRPAPAMDHLRGRPGGRAGPRVWPRGQLGTADRTRLVPRRCDRWLSSYVSKLIYFVDVPDGSLRAVA
jgi:hypothetical protein